MTQTWGDVDIRHKAIVARRHERERRDLNAQQAAHIKRKTIMQEAREYCKDHWRFEERQAVKLAEGGYGWEYIAHKTGINRALARRIVLGLED